MADMRHFGTRDEDTMRAYARNARSVGELRAVLAEAERDLDHELAVIIRAELQRRGL
jgi:hypothetical protein